jgi:hypothetical protein
MPITKKNMRKGNRRVKIPKKKERKRKDHRAIRHFLETKAISTLWAVLRFTLDCREGEGVHGEYNVQFLFIYYITTNCKYLEIMQNCIHCIFKRV